MTRYLIAAVIVLAFLTGLFLGRAMAAHADEDDPPAIVHTQPRLFGPHPIPSTTTTSTTTTTVPHRHATVRSKRVGINEANRALGQQMVAKVGWIGDQWACLDRLISHESGWHHDIFNERGSGAYGIPQALPGRKMASAGDDWRTNPATQIRWLISYISGRYGTPCAANHHSLTKGWY